MPGKKDPRKYRPLRMGKRDYRSMTIDIIAFSRIIFKSSLSLDDGLSFADLPYLLVTERLVKKWRRPVTISDIYIWCSMDRTVIYLFVARNIERGYIIEVSKGKFEPTQYANAFIKRFSTNMNRFLSGKIQSPYN